MTTIFRKFILFFTYDSNGMDDKMVEDIFGIILNNCNDDECFIETKMKRDIKEIKNNEIFYEYKTIGIECDIYKEASYNNLINTIKNNEKYSYTINDTPLSCKYHMEIIVDN